MNGGKSFDEFEITFKYEYPVTAGTDDSHAARICTFVSRMSTLEDCIEAIRTRFKLGVDWKVVSVAGPNT